MDTSGDRITVTMTESVTYERTYTRAELAKLLVLSEDTTADALAALVTGDDAAAEAAGVDPDVIALLGPLYSRREDLLDNMFETHDESSVIHRSWDADVEYTCRGCGRDETTCSKHPCADVIADREA